jgi:hypothetical protein
MKRWGESIKVSRSTLKSAQRHFGEPGYFNPCSPLPSDQYSGFPHGRINRKDATPKERGQSNTKEIEIYLSGLRVFAVSLLTDVPLALGRKTIEKTTAE